MSNAKQGGDLASMAKDGTSIPGDAGVYNVLPSVPRPDQPQDSSLDNAIDIPRSNADSGETGEVATGTGDVLPAAVESKRLHAVDAGNPADKGHQRDAKHGGQHKQEGIAPGGGGEGAQVEAAPGEEEEGQDVLMARREGDNVARMRRESNV